MRSISPSHREIVLNDIRRLSDQLLNRLEEGESAVNKGVEFLYLLRGCRVVENRYFEEVTYFWHVARESHIQRNPYRAKV